MTEYIPVPVCLFEVKGIAGNGKGEGISVLPVRYFSIPLTRRTFLKLHSVFFFLLRFLSVFDSNSSSLSPTTTSVYISFQFISKLDRLDVPKMQTIFTSRLMASVMSRYMLELLFPYCEIHVTSQRLRSRVSKLYPWLSAIDVCIQYY